MKDFIKLEYVVCFDDLTEEIKKKVSERGLKLLFFKDLIKEK